MNELLNAIARENRPPFWTIRFLEISAERSNKGRCPAKRQRNQSTSCFRILPGIVHKSSRFLALLRFAVRQMDYFATLFRLIRSLESLFGVERQTHSGYCSLRFSSGSSIFREPCQMLHGLENQSHGMQCINRIEEKTALWNGGNALRSAGSCIRGLDLLVLAAVASQLLQSLGTKHSLCSFCRLLLR
jgi:hypothetical protein